MFWYKSLNGQGFRQWILDVASGTRISQGQRLDPFATSMRVFKDVSTRLAYIEEHQRLDVGGDPNQAVTDLRGAQLIQGSTASANLTDLGQAVLHRWRELGIDNNQDDDELPRCIVVVRLAIELGNDFYRGMITFWKEVRELYSVDDLLTSPASIYLVSYLNQAVNGFNPWQVIRSTHAEAFTSPEIDWEQLKAGLPDQSADVLTAVEALRRRVNDAATRSIGRTNFCRAMELSLQPPAVAHDLLQRWQLSVRTTDRCKAALPVVTTYDTITPEIEPLFNLVNERVNVICYGPPGTGKTHHAFLLAAAWERRYGSGTVFRVTFHPSYGYEDFVQGYRPDEATPGIFYKQEGILLRACNAARRLLSDYTGDGQMPSVLLVIDEINRGDISRIFGELITYIEPDKRDMPVYLSQSPKLSFSIPPNLYFLGTMNTADKSISLLDVALRRRFAFVEFPPDPTIFASASGWLESVGSINLGTLLDGLNTRLKEAGIEVDRAIGHALLYIPSDAADPVDALRKRIQYDIQPLINEYCYADRSAIKSILGAIVDDDGRFNHTIANDAFMLALGMIATTMPSEDIQAVVTDETADEADEGGAGSDE